ncbi:MAG: AAA family ATPase [Clostridia bacterium]|nr:AAA family ATPase [Clostridia bacterium]
MKDSLFEISEPYFNDTRSDHDEEYTLKLRVKTDKKILTDFISYFPKMPGGVLPSAVRWLLGGKFTFEMYLANASTSDHPDSINLVLASDTSSKPNSDLLGELSGMTLSIFGFNTPGWFYVTRIRKVPLPVGSISNRVIKANVTLCYNPDNTASNMPQKLLNRIFELPNILEETKVINQRISHWEEYLKINEHIAEEAQLLIPYSGFTKSISRFVFSADCHSLNSSHSGSDVQLVLGVEYENGHPIYKGPVIGTLDSFDAKKGEITVNPDFDFAELLQNGRAEIPHRAKLFFSKWGDLVQIRRLQAGLRSFARGQAANPYLDVFLFDASKARYPQIPGVVLDREDMLQPNLNPEQKRAVEGVINSDDIYLIQGPPGTGKTTVIAEICYQNAIRGQKTLIASQTNLAVDNALGKLIHHPKIRALRKGNEQSVQEEGKLFTEENVIRTWLDKTASDCIEQMTPRAANLIKAYEAEERLDFIISQYELYTEASKQRNTNAIQKATLERKLEEYKQDFSMLRKSLISFCENCDDESARYIISARLVSDYSLKEKVSLCCREKYTLGLGEEKYAKSTERIRSCIIKLQKLADTVSSELIRLDKNKAFVPADENSLTAPKISFERWISESKTTEKILTSAIQHKPSALVSIFKKPDEWLKSASDAINSFNCFKISSAHTVVSLKEAFEKQQSESPLQNMQSEIKDMAKQCISDCEEELTVISKELSDTQSALEQNKQDIINARENINIFNASLPYSSKADDFESIAALSDIREYYLNLWKVPKNDDEKITALQKEWSERIKTSSEADYNTFKQLYIDNANVIGITCSQSGSKEFTSLYPTFDVAIIDEVSKATPPELILSVLKAKKIVLVGDHKQLPPMLGSDTYEEVAKKLDIPPQNAEHMKQSLFEELFVSAIPELKTMLSTQYRMHTKIMENINQFYIEENGFGLTCGLPDPDKSRSHGCHGKAISESDHALWVDVPMFEENREIRSNVNFSYSNPAEVECIKHILLTINQNLTDNGFEGKKRIGIISFYSNQVRLIENEFNNEEFLSVADKLSLRIGSVDRFQGIECPVVICSFVRNNDRGEIGFAKDPRRVNVALSRAQELSVIVGSTELFCYANNSPDASAIYKTITQNIFKSGGERSVWDFKQDESD